MFFRFDDIESYPMARFNETVIDLWEWWIADLKKSGKKKDVTIASYCRSVRVFIYWLADNEYIEPINVNQGLKIREIMAAAIRAKT